MELVSIIMSTYNTNEKLLREAISSILNQTYKNIEFIIINDASTENDLNIIKSFDDSRIILIDNKVNLGLAESLNIGIKLAKGKYIARMDSDDISLSRRIEEQVKYLNEHKDIDIVGSFAKNIGSNSNLNITPLIKSEEVKIQLFNNTTLIHPTVMIKKEFLDKYKLKYDADYICAQDFEFWTRCSEYGKICIIPKVLLFYRIHNRQASNKKKTIQKKYADYVLKRQLEKIKINYDNNEYEAHLILSGLKEFDKNKVEMIYNWINKLIKYNKISKVYDDKKYEYILKNKFLNIYLKSDKNKIKLLYEILINKYTRNLINFHNVKNLGKRINIIIRNKLFLIEN